MNDERVTTYALVLNELLHKIDDLSLIAPTYSSMLTLMNQARNSKWQHDFALLSAMGYGHIFLGLKWIEMVDILVGEVDRRSPKDGVSTILVLLQ